MEVTTERFIRKPLYVDAVRVTAQNFDAVAAWCNGEIQKETEGPRTGKSYIRVRVQYPKSPRQSKAFVGDWVLYTETGYKVYTNASFRKSFDLELVAKEERPATADEIREKLPHAQDRRPTTPPVQIEPDADLGTTPQGEQIEVVTATPQAIADAVNEQQSETDVDKDYPEGHRIGNVEETPIAPPPTPAIVPPEPVEEPRLPVETDDEHKIKHESQTLSKPVGLDEADAEQKIETAGQPEPVSEQAPEDAAAGKRVLSVEEQDQMGPDAVREMVRTGDVILAQDLAA